MPLSNNARQSSFVAETSGFVPAIYCNHHPALGLLPDKVLRRQLLAAKPTAERRNAATSAPFTSSRPMWLQGMLPHPLMCDQPLVHNKVKVKTSNRRWVLAHQLQSCSGAQLVCLSVLRCVEPQAQVEVQPASSWPHEQLVCSTLRCAMQPPLNAVLTLSQFNALSKCSTPCATHLAAVGLFILGDALTAMPASMLQQCCLILPL
jgi:hypothetical protein